MVVMAPWWARQLAVFGSLSPSTASGKVFFIRDIGEWNSIATPATLEHLLGMGIGPLIASRIDGLVAAIIIFTTLVAGFVLAPFMLIGGWLRRRSVDFGPFFAYAALLFAFSAIVSAVHVPGGTFIHSAIALAPYAYILALEGIVAAVAWIARRRPAWDADQASRIFVGAAIGFAVLCTVRGIPRRPRGLGRPPGQVRDDRERARGGRRQAHRSGDVDRRVGHQVLDRAAAASSSSTTRSTRSRRSPAPTTSTGSSSSRRRGGRVGRAHPRRPASRLGRARRS